MYLISFLYLILLKLGILVDSTRKFVAIDVIVIQCRWHKVSSDMNPSKGSGLECSISLTFIKNRIYIKRRVINSKTALFLSMLKCNTSLIYH